MSRRSAPACGGSTTLETRTTPSATSTASAPNGQADPTTNSAAPSGGPASWLKVIIPVSSREFADRQVVAGDQHRQQRLGAGVGEHLRGATAGTTPSARRRSIPAR